MSIFGFFEFANDDIKGVSFPLLDLISESFMVLGVRANYQRVVFFVFLEVLERIRSFLSVEHLVEKSELS